MGMFDYVRCEVPLPDGFAGELQTKDFACEMGTHTISKDGRLILAVLDHTEEVPLAERPHPNAEGLLKWAGSIRFIWRYEDADFHGILNFYAYDGTETHEYNAKFTDGNLVGIEQVSGAGMSREDFRIERCPACGHHVSMLQWHRCPEEVGQPGPNRDTAREINKEANRRFAAHKRERLEDPPEAVIARGVQMLRTPRSGSDETLVHDIWQAMLDEFRAAHGAGPMTEPTKETIRENPMIAKYLDISTAHVTQEDMELLDGWAVSDSLDGAADSHVPVIASYSEGAICYVPSDLDDAEEAELLGTHLAVAGLSPSFLKVLRLARELDCQLVRLDRDGERLLDDNRVDTHEW
jgi:hypothetical protein